MKIKILAALAVTALLAVGANGQGTGGATTGGTTSTGTSGGVNAPANPRVTTPGINSGVVTPANPSQGNGRIILAPPINPNTPIVGQGMGANNTGLGSNNLALGTNAMGLGSNQFALRTNGLGTNFLTPTGPSNGSGVLSNNIQVNPTAGTNIILLKP